MRRKLSLLVAFVGVLGLIGLVPASANHGGKALTNFGHENSPSPPALPLMEIDGECVVLGAVEIGDENGSGGVSADQKNHNHFRFVATTFECLPMGGDGENYDRVYTIDAAGGTDGQGGQGTKTTGSCDGIDLTKDPKCHDTSHGENLSVGWSHSSCYAGRCALSGAKKNVGDIYDGTNTNPATPGHCYNCGEIRVERIDSVSEEPDGKRSGFGLTSENWLKFCRGIYDDTDDGVPNHTCSNADNLGEGDKLFASRGGGNVIVWGVLKEWTQDGVPDPAKAGEILCFVFDLELTPIQNADSPDKFINAALVGEADVWVVGSKAECTGEKNKT